MKKLADRIRSHRTTLLAGVTTMPAAGSVAFAWILLGGWAGSTQPTQLSVTARNVGPTVELVGIPKEIKGGIVKIRLTNRTKDSHALQLLRLLGNHTAAEALNVFTNPHSTKTPAWLRAEGGVGSVDPGMTRAAIVALPVGRYVAFDYLSGGASPPRAEFTVTRAKRGALPTTPGHVTARRTGKDRYAWRLDGLRRGNNRVTFASGGKDAIHLILAVPVGRHSLAQVKRALVRTLIHNKPPPAFLDLQHATDAAELDGGHQDVVQLNLRRGTYVFVCPLTDRDGGKPHFLEGLLKEVTIR